MALIGEKETTDIISSQSYLGTLLLGTLPIVGDIMLAKWSKDNEVRINKQNLCKAYLKLKIMLIYPVWIISIILPIMIIKLI